MLDTIIDNLEKFLPHNYTETGNLKKLIDIFKLELNRIKTAKDNMYIGLDIDKATGIQLDIIGREVGEKRQGRDDPQYRKAIKVRIKANTSGGDIPTLNEVGKVLIGDAFIGINELWDDDKYDNEPAAFAIVFDYQQAFEEISQEYEDIDNDPWFLDGEYLLDGERLLDGGYTFDLSARLDDITALLDNIKSLMKEVAAGGVRVYVELPDNIEIDLLINNEMTMNISNYTELPRAARLDGSFVLNGNIRLDGGVKPTYNSYQETINKTEQTQVNVLDGSTLLDGGYLLDADRDFVVHNAEIQEVVA